MSQQLMTRSTPSLNAQQQQLSRKTSLPRHSYIAELEFDSDESKEEKSNSDEEIHEESKDDQEREDDQNHDDNQDNDEEDNEDNKDDEADDETQVDPPSSSLGILSSFDFSSLIAQASTSLATKLLKSNSSSKSLNHKTLFMKRQPTRIIQSSSNLNDLFTHTQSSTSREHESDSIPAGFEKRNGVLYLTSSLEKRAAEQTTLDTQNSSSVPDLHASSIPPSHNPMVEKKSSREIRSSNAGKNWFNFSRPSVITPEMKRDLQLLSLRAYMDPRKFYKKETTSKKKLIPTHFAMGTVIEGAHEFYSSRLTQSQRTQHYSDEYLKTHRGDSEHRKMKHYLKRKVMEVQRENTPISRTFNKKRKQIEEASSSRKKGKKPKK